MWTIVVWVVALLRVTFADMDQTEFEKTLALAGVCQAAALVQQLARKGQTDQDAFEATINSIVITDPQNTEEVFGGQASLRTGLKTLIGQLGNTPDDKDAEVTRYIASILGLERKLKKQPKRLNELAERISNAQRQLNHLALFESQMMANLASIYSDNISPIGPKIQVAGNPELLKQSSSQQKVRALLLAGVRAAVLWRQLGGKRRHILFNRKKVLAAAEQILQRINNLH